MKFHRTQTAENPRTMRRRVRWFGILAGLAAVAIALAVGGGMPQAQNNPLHNSPEIVRAPDSNQVNDINRQQVERQNFEAANAERKKQMSQESAKLLKLAAALKAEVDKNDKDALPPGAMRKADEIEKLAHSVKEKMQLTVGPS